MNNFDTTRHLNLVTVEDKTFLCTIFSTNHLLRNQTHSYRNQHRMKTQITRPNKKSFWVTPGQRWIRYFLQKAHIATTGVHTGQRSPDFTLHCKKYLLEY